MKEINLDEVIEICKKFEELRDLGRYNYGNSPEQMIETCKKLKAEVETK